MSHRALRYTYRLLSMASMLRTPRKCAFLSCDHLDFEPAVTPKWRLRGTFDSSSTRWLNSILTSLEPYSWVSSMHLHLHWCICRVVVPKHVVWYHDVTLVTSHMLYAGDTPVNSGLGVQISDFTPPRQVARWSWNCSSEITLNFSDESDSNREHYGGDTCKLWPQSSTQWLHSRPDRLRGVRDP